MNNDKKKVKINREEIKKECQSDPNEFYSNKCNQLLVEKEEKEREYARMNVDDVSLYPTLSDENFNRKISLKKEFADNKYDGTIHTNIQEQADKLANAPFELQPHQMFSKNYLSFQTPYRSILLFHGPGSGKTCSAIGICEETRKYNKQIGNVKPIMFIAGKNVQENFKLQLFDERKLNMVDGMWDLNACTGNTFLKEINPMNVQGMPREKVIRQIQNIIASSYTIMGYIELANHIIRVGGEDSNGSEITPRLRRKIQAEFSGRTIVIDEVHNIRQSGDKDNKKVTTQIEVLVKCAENMSLILMSGTPLYDNFREIFWLVNILNINERRSLLNPKEVIDKNGHFLPNGKEVLKQKITGLISYVRGENPYTFPYRVYPKLFAPERTFPAITYPTYQMNLKRIRDETKIKALSLYTTTLNDCNKCGNCQLCAYRYVMHVLRQNMNEDAERFGITMMSMPMEILTMSYPSPLLKKAIQMVEEPNFKEEEAEMIDITEDKVEDIDNNENEEEINETKKNKIGGNGEANNMFDYHVLAGIQGLHHTMKFKNSKSPPIKGEFEYIDKTNRFFKPDKIGRYSAKIKTVIDNIHNEGIALVYSRYIDGGVVPMALALEEMGFTRYNGNNLFKDVPTEPIDAITMQPRTHGRPFMPAKYAIITGDIKLSPNPVEELKALTDDDNRNGEKIKVVLITKAGSESIDMKCIRQVFILDAWYNLNQSEQTIARAVRNLSHKLLDFEKRNVMIYLMATILGINSGMEETADMYIYRLAEFKSRQIGIYTRIMRENAVDMYLNADQMNFTQENMAKKMEAPVSQILSNGVEIENFPVGDEAYSAVCDYMEKCDYIPKQEILSLKNEKPNEDTFSETFIMSNMEQITKKVKRLYKLRFFYEKEELIEKIQTPKPFSYIQIYSALTQLIDDHNETITDKYGRLGHLINVGEYYLYQPNELTDRTATIYERSVPIEFKHDAIHLRLHPPKNKIQDLVNNEGRDDNAIDTLEEQGQQIIANIEKEIKTNEWMTKSKNGMEVFQSIFKEQISIMPNIIHKMIVEHFIETLMIQDKKALVDYIYSLPVIENESIERIIKEYFDKHILHISNRYEVGIMMYDNLKMYLFRIKEGKRMEIFEPEDYREFMADSNVRRQLKLNMAEIVGYMGYDKTRKHLVFKTKQVSSKRDTGARCDESGRPKIIARMFAIYGDEIDITNKKMGITDLCVLTEMICRFYDMIEKDGKRWHLTPEEAMYYRMVKA